jgi:hypothetical protein
MVVVRGGSSRRHFDAEGGNEMRKIAFIAALALVVPGAALAAKPSHPATPANGNASSNANGTSTTGKSSTANGKSAKVMFVLHVTLGTYTAANGAINGSIAFTVNSANHGSTVLKGAGTLTLPVSSSTKIVGTVTGTHAGIVKVRAPKNVSAADLVKLTAFQVIDQGASS